MELNFQKKSGLSPSGKKSAGAKSGGKTGFVECCPSGASEFHSEDLRKLALRVPSAPGQQAENKLCSDRSHAHFRGQDRLNSTIRHTNKVSILRENSKSLIAATSRLTKCKETSLLNQWVSKWFERELHVGVQAVYIPPPSVTVILMSHRPPLILSSVCLSPEKFTKTIPSVLALY